MALLLQTLLLTIMLTLAVLLRGPTISQGARVMADWAWTQGIMRWEVGMAVTMDVKKNASFSEYQLRRNAFRDITVCADLHHMLRVQNSTGSVSSRRGGQRALLCNNDKNCLSMPT